ncbi:DUF3139 domain-containing protein [Paenibacillus wenxiniae]|uniref:DUF3139 domain-containing protein n=1 Tax=Paenibacillus wenxiniae TaxID=1636843 RepID=A0ABW4RHF0_9BACL
MKRKILFLATFVLIIIVTLYGHIQLMKHMHTKDVEAYLEQKGYSASDILSIETDFSKAPAYNTRVIFKDEPTVTYYYLKNDAGVRQYSTPSSEDEKLQEDKGYHFKHREAYNN